MKSAIFASLVAAVSAFAPAQQAAKTTALNAYETELGAQAPLGFYDPAGMLTNASPARFARLREVELKHGRISMLAVVGYLVTAAGIRLPGDISYGTPFTDIPAGFAAVSAVPKEGWGQIVGFIFFLEMIMRDVSGKGEFVGDFRNGAIDFGWDKFDDATKLKKRAIELNQGRAAQMGILALMVHEQLGVPLIPQ